MEIINEAGIFGPLTILLFMGGLVATLTVGRSRGAILKTAMPFAVALVALGQVGQSVAQRFVADAVDKVGDLPQKVGFLNAGTAEASSCLLLGGGGALALCVLAAAIHLADRRR